MTSTTAPLYVGITTDLDRRLREHRRKAWSGAIAQVDAVTFSSEEVARREEASRIHHLRPAHNSLLPRRTPRPRPARSATMLLVESKLGEPMVEFVRARRRAGASWIDVAFDLRAATDVAVGPETVRIWAAHEPDMERRKAGAA